MQLMERVKGILLKPRETWAAIDGEPADTARLFTGYSRPFRLSADSSACR